METLFVGCKYFKIFNNRSGYSNLWHMFSITVFLQSDAVPTIFSAACFCEATFESGYYSRVTFISLESLQTSTTAG